MIGRSEAEPSGENTLISIRLLVSILTSQFISGELVMDTNATNGFLSTFASQQHLPLPLNLFDYIANLAIKLPPPNQAKPAKNHKCEKQPVQSAHITLKRK
jgi:hypothetical protein